MTRHTQPSEPRACSDAIVARVLRACDPARAVADAWPAELGEPVTIVALGKASIAMARAAVDHLGQAVGGVVVCPADGPAHALPASLAVYHADHPIPTQRNLDAARAVESCVRTVRPGSTLLLLVSGGGSAHLCAPWPGLSLEELSSVTRDLLLAGATIEQLNTVRKHCEQLKGGRLAALAVSAGASVRALVLSDVPGDPLDAIASGPAAPDPTTYARALVVLKQAGCVRTHRAIADHLGRGVAGDLPETPKPGDPIFARVEHAIIASNRTAVDAAASACERLGFGVVDRRDGVRGEARAVGAQLAEAIAQVHASGRTMNAIVWGGETTVAVGGASGVGGRCQEAALAAALALEGTADLAVMTLATDGVDGPTDAAGALVTSHTRAGAQARRLDLADALARHDSHGVLDRLGCLIRTGPTGTNLNDVLVAWTIGPA